MRRANIMYTNKNKRKKRRRRTFLTPELFLRYSYYKKGVWTADSRLVRFIANATCTRYYIIFYRQWYTILWNARVIVYYGVQLLIKYEFVFTSPPQQVVRGYNNILFCAPCGFAGSRKRIIYTTTVVLYNTRFERCVLRRYKCKFQTCN